MNTVAKYKTREQWLTVAIDRLARHFKKVGEAVPMQIRASVGWTSMGKRTNRIGECWSDVCSADDHFEIFISPTMSDPVLILDVLIHEMVHAVVGLEAKHGPAFRKVALAIGLTGKMRSTVAGPELRAELELHADWLGPIPHGALTAGLNTGPKKQSTRMIKGTCSACGFVCRASATQIAAISANGTPRCPDVECDGELAFEANE